MGIFTRKPVYISDRGEEFAVEDMKPSHLLNVLAHHQKQLIVLNRIIENSDRTAAELGIQRLTALEDTLDTLSAELLTRDPAKDHDDYEISRGRASY